MAVDIEATFDKAIYAMGGVRVTDRAGRAPSFANADYVFDDRRIIAELKCLEDDKVKDPRIVARASEIYRNALDNGGTSAVIYGQRRVTSDIFREPYRTQLHDLYRRPVENVVRKAHTQIAETKQRLGLDGYRGLFLIANQGHTALDPWNVVHLLTEIFIAGAYPEIHHIVFFTVDLKATVAGFPNGASLWLPFIRSGYEQMPASFEKRLRRAWLGQLEAVTGQSQSYVNLPNYDSVISARNLNTPSR